MPVTLRALITVLVLLTVASSPALAGRRSGGGVPGCEQAVTNVPWGTVDTSCVGGPSGPNANGWTGGTGGPGMRISEQGHKNWPNFHAPVCGHGWVACNPYTNPLPQPAR